MNCQNEQSEALLSLVEDADRDMLFDVLSSRRRRCTLSCLRDHENPLPLADVAEEVAIQETGRAITDIPAEDVKEVYISLYHAHVPKMEDAGIVRYSQERDSVALESDAKQLASDEALLDGE